MKNNNFEKALVRLALGGLFGAFAQIHSLHHHHDFTWYWDVGISVFWNVMAVRYFIRDVLTEWKS